MRSITPVQCTYRGWPLDVVSISDSSGRSWVQHQYLGGNHIDLEQTGRLPDRFELEVLVNGRAWLADLRSIRRLLDEPTPAVFVHPFLGRFFGVMQDMQVTHTDRQHDHARVRMTFVAGGEQIKAFAVTQTVPSAVASAELASAAATAALAALEDS